LERRCFCRVGGTEELSVDVRVIAATNRDLRTEVNAGTFRLDLYYRLAVVTLELAPLRERASDIPQLIEHFLREEGSTAAMTDLLPPATLAALQRHRWPGNLRELRNFVQATLAMGEPMPLRQDSAGAPGAPLGAAFTPLLGLPYTEARRRLLEEFEAQYVGALMERAQGNVARAAREAEMARSHLHELIRRHGRTPP
jgi:DNA-binding NtrC family response regulator